MTFRWGWEAEIDGGMRRGPFRFFGVTFGRYFVGVWRTDRSHLTRSLRNDGPERNEG